jgi:hypothetical protein
MGLFLVKWTAAMHQRIESNFLPMIGAIMTLMRRDLCQVLTRLFVTFSLITAMASGPVMALSPAPPLPVDTLEAFYEAMNGEQWHRNDGWLDPDVHVCDWYGITCVIEFPEFGGFNWIGRIRLPNNNLHGEFSSLLIEQLNGSSAVGIPSIELDLSGNAIGGQLPELPVGIPRLILANNLFEGPLPTPGTSSPPPEMRLTHLDLSGNDFSGTIPDLWRQVLVLRHLDLSDNRLEGSIETALGTLANGAVLRLADNPMSGHIDPEWLVDINLDAINLCWTEVVIDDAEVESWLELVHEGGSPQLCMGRDRLPLDPGVSGSWFDLARPGEGFTMMLLENGTPLVYWFSHVSYNRQFWLFNSGHATMTTTHFRPLLRTRGEFGLGFSNLSDFLFRGGELRLDRVGDTTLHAEFRVSYQYNDRVQPGDIGITPPYFPDLSFRSDHVQLSRLAGTRCDNQNPNQWISGAWYIPGQVGEGFVVEVIEDGRGVVYWFSYPPSDNGEGTEPPPGGDWQAWMTGDGHFEGNTLNIENLWQPRDTAYGMPFDAEGLANLPFGSLSLSFHDDLTGEASFDGIDENYGSNHFPIERLARPMLAECEHPGWIRAKRVRAP